METDENIIKAPFDLPTIKALNRYQKNGNFHPYTCRDTPSHNLVATEDGWHCPNCPEFHQGWADAQSVKMADFSWTDLTPELS